MIRDWTSNLEARRSLASLKFAGRMTALQAVNYFDGIPQNVLEAWLRLDQAQPDFELVMEWINDPRSGG